VEVVDPVPGSVEIHVRDHLARVRSSSKFDLPAAAHAANVVAGLDSSHDSPRSAHVVPAAGFVLGTACLRTTIVTLTR
jgi:hypothetical protein